MIITVSVIVLLLGIATYNRNKVWKTTYSLWADTLSKSPNRARPITIVGIELYKRGERESVRDSVG